MAKEQRLVVIPTVSERSGMCQQTVDQWQALGYESMLFLTPDETPRSPAQQGISALLALAHAWRCYGPCSSFFCEDDVILDARLAQVLFSFFAEEATTLYLPGQRFYPASIKQRLATPPKVPLRFPIIGFSSWFGSQCLFLPQAIIAHLLQEEHAPVGFDLILRASLQRQHRMLYGVFPNLVQHMGLPSVTSARYKPHRSTTWTN